MTETDHYPQYLVGHLRQVLAEDDRTHLLDVQIKVLAGRVFVLGVVESAERRAAAERVIRELVGPDMVVVNELCVADYASPPETEEMP